MLLSVNQGELYLIKFYITARILNQAFFFNYMVLSEYVGLSMMCYTLGKANKMCLGERQLSGRIGKLLYWRWRTANCFLKSSKE